MSKVYVEMTEEEYLSWLEFKSGKKIVVEAPTEEEMEEILNTKTIDVFKPRISAVLRHYIGVSTIRELINHTEYEIKNVRTIGEKAIQEINKWLTEHNLCLAH